MNGAEENPLMVCNYPRAIVHVDGDAFFTSVEQALNPALRGRPVVTGQERGIIACASYEAKALGVKRGITLREAQKLCPGLVILPSDYEAYGLYSSRMFNIIRSYTPVVEEYSIDEAFAEITGMRRVFRCSYEEIARQIQEHIRRELGITVSVGLGITKSLAKLCSKFRKPSGFTAVPGRLIHLLLPRIPLDAVWGFGPNTVGLLGKLGLKTAYDFIARPEGWAGKLLGKPGREIWHELRGNSLWKVNPAEKTSWATIIKSKTFTPPSRDAEQVFARLVHNVESAFARARRYRLRPGMVGVVLRRQTFQHDGLEAHLSRPSAVTLEVLPLIREMFDRIFVPGVDYRATMIVLGRLENDAADQFEFFEDRPRLDSLRRVAEAVDSINTTLGRNSVRSGAALCLAGVPRGTREELPPRRRFSFSGETVRRRLAIPRMDIAV